MRAICWGDWFDVRGRGDLGTESVRLRFGDEGCRNGYLEGTYFGRKSAKAGAPGDDADGQRKVRLGKGETAQELVGGALWRVRVQAPGSAQLLAGLLCCAVIDICPQKIIFLLRLF